MQCLERHSTPRPPVGSGWLSGVCGCFVDRFVGGFGGGVTPGPFPNPVAKPTCADGTAPGRVWESRSPPALNMCGRSCPLLWSTSGRSGWGRGLLLFVRARSFRVRGRTVCLVPGCHRPARRCRVRVGRVARRGRIHPADAHPDAGPVAAGFSALPGQVPVPAWATGGGCGA